MGLLSRRARIEPDEIRAQTLEWVNKMRRSWDRHELKDFPKGIPNTTLKCPISLAFEDIFGTGLVLTSAAYLRHASTQRVILKLPDYVSLFVGIFDDRGYLDLVNDDPRSPNNFMYVPDDWIENYYTLGRCA